MKKTSLLCGALCASLISMNAALAADNGEKILAEGQLSSINVINQTADLIATSGLKAAIAVSEFAHGNWMSFGSASVSSSRYNTSSYINTLGSAMMVGLAKNFGRDVMLGVYLEGGYGHYKTHNDIMEMHNLTGVGNTTNYGIGMLARYDYPCIKGLYAEGSVHGGYMHNFWDLENYGEAGYKNHGVYVGTHVGLGYENVIAKTVGFDIYGKYFYNHQTGKDTEIDGRTIKFENVNSHRTRFGARFDLRVVDALRPYIGAAWEQEYDATARASVADYSIDAPTAKGATGVFEVGVATNRDQASKWDIDGTFQAFTGKRQGIGGMIRAHYAF
ncbi:MAG: autotransporter outer membrane beta-barrel domain-containing protein [Alphaproteobacteria bacterium]|nr:autotransporter outer membrane beta-barrel domain-containing protein [Alphaproteobacteria bacterium]